MICHVIMSGSHDRLPESEVRRQYYFGGGGNFAKALLIPLETFTLASFTLSPTSAMTEPRQISRFLLVSLVSVSLDGIPEKAPLPNTGFMAPTYASDSSMGWNKRSSRTLF